MPDSVRLRHIVERRWYGGTAPLWLRPLSAVYGLAIRVRRMAYRRGWLTSRHPGIPVIVIGNLTVGGTGKTPLVIWLAEALREAGQQPGVLLRGHGRRGRDVRLVAAGDAAPDVGDEALLIARRAGVPVAVGADRVAAAALLVRQGCTLLLCDDGLQHLRLRRDLEVVVVDGARGFGNGALLPAGPLREPATRLAAADLVVLHGEDEHGVVRRSVPLQMTLLPGMLRELRTGRAEPLDSLRGATVHAVAGIGHPQRFFGLLRGLGARPVEHDFADHHPYRREDLDFNDDWRIVMTEKDAVKCAAFANGRMWYLPVSASLPEADARRLLFAICAKVPGGRDEHA